MLVDIEFLTNEDNMLLIECIEGFVDGTSAVIFG
jgi:hypothetical protein